MDIVGLFWKNKAQRHAELKKQIEMMQVDKNFLVITKAPQFIIDKANKKIGRLQKKLRCHINTG